jgi:hypothetical protein
MTTTLNTSDDTVGSASAVVYFLVTNATEYNYREIGTGRQTQIAPGEVFGLTAEEKQTAIRRGQSASSRSMVPFKYRQLTALTAESGEVA